MWLSLYNGQRVRDEGPYDKCLAVCYLRGPAG